MQPFCSYAATRFSSEFLSQLLLEGEHTPAATQCLSHRLYLYHRLGTKSDCVVIEYFRLYRTARVNKFSMGYVHGFLPDLVTAPSGHPWPRSCTFAQIGPRNHKLYDGPLRSA